VDNALDAGARTITIETTAGGRGMIRVTDDGCDMSARDAVLALERHATSKLRAIDDLWHLTSMGFRGEALAAIASVSRLVLTSRRAADLGATRVSVEGGRLLGVTEAGAAAGTSIEVGDLLFNQPARQKFLKAEPTEASHITDLVAKLAMAHPAIHFRLRHNGRTALEVPPDRDGFARACALLGPRVAARLVATHGEEAGFRITAYLASPDLAQTTARGVQIFVGRRPIRDRNLLHAIAMGYGELVARGRYPLAVLHLDAPAGSVDVNVHPQKQEVRFADPAAVAAAVRHVVQAGIATAPWRAETGLYPVHMIASTSIAPPALPLDDQPATPLAERYARDLRRSGTYARHAGTYPRAAGQGSLFDAGGTRAAEPYDHRAAGPSTARAWAADIQARARAARAAERRLELRETIERPSSAARQPFASDAALHRAQAMPVPWRDAADAAGVAGVAGAADDPAVAGDTGDPLSSAFTRRPLPADACLRDDPDAARPSAVADGSGPLDASSTTAGYFSRLRYLGQLDLTYLVCEAAGELVLVDQHAAHERVELARLLARPAHDLAVQRMLFPVTIDATPTQLALVERVGDALAQVGYEAEAFGKATLAIKAVPAGIRHGDPAQLLRRLLADWERDGTPSGDPEAADDVDTRTRLLAEIACHSVVRAGDRLDIGEAEALLRALDDVDPTTPAPHGKALLMRLPLAEIGRRFGR
jgi:DNA mismatch repair protein MutL